MKRSWWTSDLLGKPGRGDEGRRGAPRLSQGSYARCQPRILVHNLSAGYGLNANRFGHDVRSAAGMPCTVADVMVGKTTLLATLMGLTTRHLGRILTDGRDISAYRTSARGAVRYGMCPQTRGILDHSPSRRISRPVWRRVTGRAGQYTNVPRGWRAALHSIRRRTECSLIWRNAASEAVRPSAGQAAGAAQSKSTHRKRSDIRNIAATTNCMVTTADWACAELDRVMNR